MYSAKRNLYSFVIFVRFCSNSYPVHHQTLYRQKKCEQKATKFTKATRGEYAACGRIDI